MRADHLKEIILTFKTTYKLTHTELCHIMGVSTNWYYKILNNNEQTVTVRQTLLIRERLKNFIRYGKEACYGSHYLVRP